MAEMKLKEKMTLDAASIRVTDEGFLACMPRIARTGIQIYSGAEMGVNDKATVRVYRPEGEVFNVDALKSIGHRTVTLDHPPEMVSAKNWREYAVGHCGGDIARDGSFIRIPMMIMDQRAIEAIRSGRAQLSVGYTSDVKWGEGKTPDGETYDAIQTTIRANHVAVVGMARGGSKLRIGDNSKGESAMLILDVKGVRVELDDKDHSIVSNFIKELETQIADAKKAVDTAKEASAAQIATLTADAAKLGDQVKAKDAEIVALKKQVEDGKISPQMIADAAREMADVVGKARILLGDKLVTEGKFASDIKRQVVDAKLGDKAKNWSDGEVNAAFTSFTADIKQETGSGNSSYDVAAAFSSPGHPGNANFSDADKAYGENVQYLENAWRGDQRKAG